MKPCLLLLSILPLLAQAPVHVDYSCTAEDFDSFGLSCSEEQPCAVFFEVSAVDAFGPRVVVAGDIHTATTTMYGVVLTTEDGGASWSEAITRLRSTAFEQIQIIGDHGWISGQRLEPLPKDPFFLITGDGGKNWREKPLFAETRFGSITEFRFDTTLGGELIFDDSVGKTVHQELYATTTGGDGWQMRQTSSKALPLKAARDAAWTVTAPANSKTYLIEHVVNGKKEAFARFLIHIGDCK